MPAFYGSRESMWVPLWVAQILMYHNIVGDNFHGIYGVKKANTLVMTARNAALVLQWSCVYYPLQAVTRCGQVKTALRQCQRECCKTTTSPLTGLWMLHWGMHTVRVKWAEAPSCWNNTCSLIPLQLNSGITEFLNISRHKTPLKVPSKQCGAMTWLTVTPANIITFHNVSRQGAEVNCTFVWKEKFLKRKHMLCAIVLCQHCWVHIQTLAEMTSLLGPSCGQTQLIALLKALLIISTQTSASTVQWKPQKQHTSLFWILACCSKENLPHSHVKRHVFPMLKEPFCVKTAS